MNRREFLKALMGLLANLALLKQTKGAVWMTKLTEAHIRRFKAVYERLAGYLTELFEGAKMDVGNGVKLLMPQAGGGYSGFWPDDGLYPLIALPSLANKDELQAGIEFISDSMLELEYVADRIEPDGLPILSPGPSNQPPMTDRMPLHLPAAWVRVLDYYEGFGVRIPRKDAWAKLIERSFKRMPFANGLVYGDPQRPPIGWGFYDTIRIAGWELMTSIVVMRGLERATRLFERELPSEIRQHWLLLAKGIRLNLHRLYSPKIGGYMEGSRIGRQFGVWSNGLAHFLAPEDAKRSIVDFYRRNANAIFLRGCTRQIAEAGWEGNGPGDSYQNGGFWATGTGFVLPAIADQDPDFALKLAEELAENLPAINFAEWIGKDGQPAGAQRYLASVSVPMIGLRSILERQPLVDYF